MKRVNIKNDIKRKDFTKSASGYVQEISSGNYLEPVLVKLSDEDCWKFFQHNDWINAVINRIVADCVKVIPDVVPKDRSKAISSSLEKRIKEVKRFIENPNDNKESFREIREKVIRDLLVFGRGCIEKVHNKIGKLIEIYSLYAPEIRINADEHGNLPTKKAYALIPAKNLYNTKTKIYFDINELIFVLHQPISKSVYGLKPLDALANTVASDIMRSEYNINFFLNNGESSGILSLEGMNRKDLKKFREYWNSNFKGFKNAHRVAAVNTKVGWTRMALMNKDMEFSEYGVELRTKIFSTYNMQPVVMGVIDNTTGKLNTSEQVELYKDGAIRPILEKEAFYYTNEIIQKGLGISDLEMVFGGVNLGDVYKQNEMDIVSVQQGITTINEVRAHRGLGPVSWGDTPLSVLPGGVQVDPNTGKIQGQNQNNKETNIKQEDENSDEIEKFLKSALVKIEAIVDNCDYEEIDLKYENRLKEYEMFINGKTYKYEINIFPVGIKKTKIYNLMDLVFDISEIDNSIKAEFIKSLISNIKHCVIKNYIEKSKDNTMSDINETIIKFKNTKLYSVIFGVK
jgi:HK97 family phage portal protein